MAMTYQQCKRALRVLDHAIEHLGPTKPCGLLITEGKMGYLPSDSSIPNLSRTILAKAMCEVVKEASHE